jgi:hypothetical protein
MARCSEALVPAIPAPWSKRLRPFWLKPFWEQALESRGVSCHSAMEAVAPQASGIAREAMPEDEDEEDRCAVCFERGSFVPLPCQCKLQYCTPCWHRWLATSIIMRVRPGCPSCRTALAADFDPVRGQLVCTVSAEHGGDGQAPLDRRGRRALYAKVRRCQIQKLKEYGSIATSQDRDEPRGVQQHRDEVCAEGAEPGQPTCRQPTCVCGGKLERLSLRSRILCMLEEQSMDWRSEVQESVLDKLVSVALVRCDLCGEEATRSGAVWTCSRGQHTVLHPSAYDVCEGCFQKHTGLACQLPPSRLCRGSPPSSLSPSAPWQWLKKQMGACRRHQIVSQPA